MQTFLVEKILIIVGTTCLLCCILRTIFILTIWTRLEVGTNLLTSIYTLSGTDTRLTLLISLKQAGFSQAYYRLTIGTVMYDN